jgi:hypothetical protein
MARTKISEFSATPASNTDIDSIFIGEGMAPSNVNDAIRELMAQLKDFQVGSAGDPVTVGGVLTVQAGSASTPALTTAGDTNTGMFFPAADTIAFAEGGVEAMRLDSSGNMGLGTTPNAWNNSIKALQVNNAALASFTSGGNVQTWLANNAYYDNATGWLYKNSSVGAALYAQSFNGSHNWNTAPSGTAGNAITFTQAMTLAASGGLSIGTTTDAGAGNILVGNGQVIASAGSGTAYAARLSCAYNFPTVDTYLDSVGGASYSGQIIFRTSSGGGGMVERARISTIGDFLLGTSSKLGGGLAGIDINNASPAGITFGASGTAKGYFYLNPAGTSSQWETAAGYNIKAVSGGTGGVQLTNGSVAWAAISDERLKDIIEPITDAAQKVSSLRAVIGKYKTDEDGTRRSFLIAQDVQAVLPEAIDEEQNEEKTLSLKYTEVIPLLVAAIKEQQAIIESLKARLDAANL